jgi:hypothetical protein
VDGVSTFSKKQQLAAVGLDQKTANRCETEVQQPTSALEVAPKRVIRAPVRGATKEFPASPGIIGYRR